MPNIENERKEVCNEVKCIICGLTSGIDWHHTIQQAHGGVNSEQVPLCGGHHTLVHTLALALYKHGDEQKILAQIPSDVPKDKVALTMNLVRRLVIGRKTWEAAQRNSLAPKKGKVVVTLDSKRVERLDRLTSLLSQNGKKVSRERVLQLALDRLYQSQTAKKAVSK